MNDIPEKPVAPPASRDAAPRRRGGLGRGLSALLADTGRGAVAGPVSDDGAADRDGAQRMIAVADIAPLPGQPRRRFDPDAMAELTQSVSERGVLQPILVRPAPGGRGYQLIAGERRWRASQGAGRHDIPAIVRDLDDAETYEIALIENIQRADLSAIEEARGYARLMAEHGHQQDQLAQLVGKSRSHVANLLRLLTLPEAVQSLVDGGQLGMGHARALVGHADAEALAARAIAEGLSVRRVEALAKGLDAPADRQPRLRWPASETAGAGAGAGAGADGRPARRPDQGPRDEALYRDADVMMVENHLADMLGLGVLIRPEHDGSGSLTLVYASLDQLDMLCQRLSGERI